MDGATARAALRAMWVVVLPALLTACAASFTPVRLVTPAQLRDVQAKVVDDVTVSVSILTDEQAARHFGVDLARHGVQVLWLNVRNASPRHLWFIRNSLDPDYYSAEEVAVLSRKDVAREARERLRQHLRDESIRVSLLPGTETEGFMFLPRVEGGRYVEVRLANDAYESDATTPGRGPTAQVGTHERRFGFALPLPDGDFDYERLDPASTYAGQSLPDLTLEQLRAQLEALACCATDADARHDGDPLNVVLVGGSSEVLNSLSRSGWSFTHRIDVRTIRREIAAAVAGDAYPVAPVSSLYVLGRKQDVALQRARRSIAQRNHMRLWLAPFTFERRSVWIGQVSRDIGIKVTPKSPTLTTHIIDPQVDATREYLLHSLMAEGFVDRFGFVKGGPLSKLAQPRENLTGDAYISDGMRLVVVLATDPVAPEQIRSLHWEQSAPPIAEGQSEAAMRNVRPIR